MGLKVSTRCSIAVFLLPCLLLHSSHVFLAFSSQPASHYLWSFLTSRVDQRVELMRKLAGSKWSREKSPRTALREGRDWRQASEIQKTHWFLNGFSVKYINFLYTLSADALWQFNWEQSYNNVYFAQMKVYLRSPSARWYSHSTCPESSLILKCS